MKSLMGKKIVNFGDSIFGKRRPPEDISTYLAEYTGAETYNIGFGGCRMSEQSYDPPFDVFGMYRLADAVASGDYSSQEAAFDAEPIEEPLPDYFAEALKTLEGIDFSKVDIVTIAYGTNDYTAKQPLDSEDKYDINSYGGALRYSIEKLSSAFPNMKLVICSQTYRFWRKDGVVTDDSNTLYCGENKLTDFVKKTKEIAEEYGLDYINNYDGDIVINESNRDVCFYETDGTHPIIPGIKIIAENISNYLTKKYGEE